MIATLSLAPTAAHAETLAPMPTAAPTSAMAEEVTAVPASSLRVAQPTAEGTMHRSTRYRVESKRLKVNEYTDQSHDIGHCTIKRNGTSCTISAGTTATRKVQLSLGMEWDAVTAGLDISSEHSQSVTVACVSDKQKAGTVVRAYAQGHLYEYRIHRWYSDSGADGDPHFGDQYSGTLQAFDPVSTWITCD